MGVDPSLEKPSAPRHREIAEAVGWSAGQMPVAAEGLEVTAFATRRDHRRWFERAAEWRCPGRRETNAPPKPHDAKGVKGFFMTEAMKKAGAVTPTANRITLLRDTDKDGAAETRSVFLSGLNSPSGMALAGDRLDIANTDAVVAVPYAKGDMKASGPPLKLVDLRGGTLNHHWTKSLIASRTARSCMRLSAQTRMPPRMASTRKRAAQRSGDRSRDGAEAYFRERPAQPERPWLEAEVRRALDCGERARRAGHNLVPDYITSVKMPPSDGRPWSYFGQTVDTPRQAGTSRHGRQGDRAGLRAGRSHRITGSCVCRWREDGPAVCRWGLHRPARLLEFAIRSAATR